MKGFFVILILAAIAASWYLVPTPPPKHHQAAIGIYFLRDYHSITTPNSVVGWTPGQEVHENLRAPSVAGNKTVSDGTIIALVSESALTQDIEDAEALRTADAGDQARARANIAATADRIAKGTLDAEVAASKSIDRTNATMVAASTVGQYVSGLNQRSISAGVGSVGYYGYPVFVGSSSAAPAVAATPSGSVQVGTTGVNAGTSQANQIMAARATAARSNAANAPAPAIPRSSATPAPAARTTW